MERADGTNEKDEPRYTTEAKVVDHANELLDEKLQHIAETKEQMDRNAGHQPVPDED